jgi:proteasome lid subunit RPN8/RPN11
MKNKKPVQTGLKLQIDSEVTRCIRQHARAHMKTEVCGVLIGEQHNDTVEVQACIEASSAAQAGTHVTFTQDAWEEIYRVKDLSYPDHRIVGWYHSHPGFGVFLSEHDTFIHKNFFSSPKQVAWVYDPHTDEEGCFGWFDGEIQRIISLTVTDNNGDGQERTPKERVLAEDEEEDVVVDTKARSSGLPIQSSPPLLKMVLNVVSYLSVAILGFFICFFLFPSVIGIAVDLRTMQPMMIDGRPITVGPIQFEEAMRPLYLEPRNSPRTAPAPQAEPPKTIPAPYLPAPAGPASSSPTPGSGK